mmetsp:Transcript_22339/g.22675  ORF Transcript_22339/g.22675 Transcript_22339/m.22675 type:complete len:105 (-) Transcript_22339:383-697(-)
MNVNVNETCRQGKSEGRPTLLGRENPTNETKREQQMNKNKNDTTTTKTSENEKQNREICRENASINHASNAMQLPHKKVHHSLQLCSSEVVSCRLLGCRGTTLN